MFLVDHIGESFKTSSADEILIVPDGWDVSYNVCLISNTLCNLYKLYKLGLKSNHVKICIVSGSDIINKFKEGDPETSLQRLKYIINLFRTQEDFRVSYSFYVTEKDLPFKSPEVSTGYWPLKRMWKGNKNQIAIRSYNYKNYDTSSSTFGFRHRGTDLSFYTNYAKSLGYEIVEYNYETPFDDLMNMFIESKFVVSDYSGLTALAMFAKTPCIIVTEQPLVAFGHNITWGFGNLTATMDLDIMGDDISVGRFDGPVECVSSSDPYIPEIIK